MDMYALLDKKRKGLALTDEEISHIVRGAARRLHPGLPVERVPDGGMHTRRR